MKTEMLEINLILMIICALTMGLGVAIGGRKIVTTVGENLINLENKSALIADFTTIITLIIASLIGIPVSTTHVKTTAIMNITTRENKINHKLANKIIIVWALTFPICGLLAFFVARYKII